MSDRSPPSLIPERIRREYEYADPDTTGRIEMVREPAELALAALREASRDFHVEQVRFMRAHGVIERARASHARRGLIVEDDAALAKLWREALRGMGFDSVHTAASFTEGRRRVTSCRYDLVVLDVKLEENGNGIELGHVIRDESLSPGVPILIVTGAMTEEDLASWGIMANATLQKPVTVDEFRASVRSILVPVRTRVHLRGKPK